MNFQIEHDVPIPKRFRQGRQLEWPWDEMNIGDSIAVEKDKRNAALQSYRHYQKTRGNCAFKHQTQGNVVRIWRIE